MFHKVKTLIVYFFLASITNVAWGRISHIKLENGSRVTIGAACYVGGDAKALFKKAYSFFYKDGGTDLTKILKINDLNAYLDKKFEDEPDKEWALEVTYNDALVAWVTMERIGDKRLRIRRCAIDPTCDIEQVVTVLLSHIGASGETIECIVHKQSETEKTLLKQFGFEEKKLTSNMYDAADYTSFERCLVVDDRKDVIAE